MTPPLAQLLFNECVVSAKKHELHFFADAQALPIRAFQCRAGQHRVLARFNALFNQVAQILQPRPSIFIRQRNAAMHFLNVGWRMKIIRFIEMPAEFVREQFSNRCFPSTRHAIDDHDHGALICRARPIFSKKKTAMTNNV